MLVLFDGWTSFFRDRVVPWRIGMAEKLRAQLETEVLPRFIAAQRWYAAKGERDQARARSPTMRCWDDGGVSWLLPLVDLEGPRERARYFLPLALAWEEHDEERMRALHAGRAGQGAPAGQRRRAGRRVRRRRRSAAPWSRRSAPARSVPTGARHAALRADGGVRRARRATTIAALQLGRAARAEQQHLGACSASAVPQGLPPPARAASTPSSRSAASSPRWRASRTACRWPARSSTSANDGTIHRRSRCCRPTSRTRATAGPTRSATSSASSSRARRRAATATRTAPTSR